MSEKQYEIVYRTAADGYSRGATFMVPSLDAAKRAHPNAHVRSVLTVEDGRVIDRQPYVEQQAKTRKKATA